MTKTSKTKADLEAMIDERIAQEPICPAGFKVEVRAEGNSWAVDCVPPPGNTPGGVAWADCCKRATAIAAELRQSYSLATNSDTTQASTDGGKFRRGGP
jgi:hypothetical protein